MDGTRARKRRPTRDPIVRTTVFLVTAILTAATGAGLLWGIATGRAAPARVTSATQPYGVGSPASISPSFSSNTSCSASACHGNGTVGRPGSEQSTWAASLGDKSDPHRRAYSVLFNAASQNIMRLLNAGLPAEKQKHAHENPLCLKCHALDEAKLFDHEVLSHHALSEGVSCDSCHGASAKWLSAHYESGWALLTSREKFEQYGFRPLKNLTARTLACASCHVGDADREVNHDLIAAGHPRLAFESARFHFAPQYLQHWSEKLPAKDFEVRAWYIGQWVNLRSAVALLESRARGVEEKPWPEFSVGGCYACHQSIGESKPRRFSPGSLDRAAGVIPWQTWYASLAKVLPAIHSSIVEGGPIPEEQVQDLLAPLAQLRVEMQKTRPNAAIVADLAGQARLRLDAWLSRLQEAEDRGAFRPTTRETSLEMGRQLVASALREDGATLRDSDWDFVAQHYLGLAAVYHAMGGASGSLAGWKPAIDRLQKSLAFEKGFNSPRDYRPDDAAVALKELQQILNTMRASR